MRGLRQTLRIVEAMMAYTDENGGTRKLDNGSCSTTGWELRQFLCVQRAQRVDEAETYSVELILVSGSKSMPTNMTPATAFLSWA